jgi:hypothetical protein
MGMGGAMTPQTPRATAEEIDAWVARCRHNLETRVPDPVEDEERAAHFETHKAKGAKK